MKKAYLFVVCAVAITALFLAACGSSKDEKLPVSDTEYGDYVGTQFSGQDPWGGNLAITVRSIAEEFGISTKDLAILNQTVIIETAQAHGHQFDDVIEYAKYLFPGEELLVPKK